METSLRSWRSPRRNDCRLSTTNGSTGANDPAPQNAACQIKFQLLKSRPSTRQVARVSYSAGGSPRGRQYANETEHGSANYRTSGPCSVASNNVRPRSRATLSFPLLLALTSSWNSTCKANISLSSVTLIHVMLFPRRSWSGPSTYRSVDLVLHGHIEVFTIQFQPVGH